MTREQLKAALRQPYQRAQGMRVLAQILPAVEWFVHAQTIADVPEGVEAIAQLGKVPLAGGRALAVLEVRTRPGIDLPRNRVALRKLVTKYIDQASYHGVLAVFHAADAAKPDYRLTLAARESVLDAEGQLSQQETAPRRYTFVLGPGEPCTTAAERLQVLIDKGKSATLVDVVDAFSVERLNKEFFKRYKEHYQRFVDHLLAGDTPQRVFGIARCRDAEEYERALKPVRDFAKKLLGRLVFLHFLQKKGWLGCPAGVESWGNGNPDFLTDLFNGAEDKERFYSNRLVPLFFEALNRNDRPGGLFAPTGTRVPYLSGGLFEDDVPAGTHALNFPAQLFADLLAFLAEYNFTIDENDPEEHEIGIDPEMLGHVFENLLEDNKDKGAYYTPKAIVQYMCQQSLLHYLQSHLGDHAELVTLIRDKDPGEATGKKNWVRQSAKEIERLLDEVKICDPAIGSGAFPIGLLQEIYWIKLTLDWTLDRAETKRRIIQQSIYGVDIDAGAVEIARLRFWLALIVEEDQPTPLPNLDFKIMQGDSLLESFEGIALDKLFQHSESGKPFAGQSAFSFDSPGTQLMLAEQQRADLVALTQRYFAESDPATKQALHGQIDAQVLTHIDDSIQAQTGLIKDELQRLKVEIRDKQRRAPAWKPPLRTAKRMALLESELKLCAERGRKLKALEGKAERPYFLWHVYFQEVFERGGFDIVIANPPYVRHETISDYRASLDPYYEVGASRADLFVFFYERAVKLLRPGGVLTFISSNKFYRAAYGGKLRAYLAKELTLREMIDFGDAPVFEAIAYASILIGEKLESRSDHEFRGYTWERSDVQERLSDVVELHASHIAQAGLDPSGWQLGSEAGLALMKKLKKVGTQLKDYVGGRLYRGIITGLNDAFVIDAPTRDLLIAEDARSAELIKPWLRGRDVKRWQTAWAGLYVIVFPFGFHGQLDAYPAIKRHLTRYKAKLQARGQCTSSRNGKGEGQHHWLELDNNPKPSYLEAFSQSKVIIPAIERQCAFAYDAEGYYANDKTSIVVSDEAPFLCAVLNSAPIWWIVKQTAASRQNGYYEFKPMYVAPLPIPQTSSADKGALSALGARAMKAAGTELAVIEREINDIVYRLFSLSPTEIALIEAESSLSAQPDSKQLLMAKVLPDLLDAFAYVSFERVAARLAELQIDIEHETLRTYLSEAMRTGVIHDAGRGWYSRLGEPFALDTKPLTPLLKLLKKDFPLLDVSAWSTAQVNAYAQHLLSTHTMFLYAEVDALPTLADHLQDRGWKVYSNPSPGEAEQRFRPGDKTVVLRPTLSKQPEGEGGAAPIEKLLVDLLAEAARLRLMDASEAQTVIANVAQAGRIPVAALLGYAKRRSLEISYFNESINSKSGDELDLMDQE